MHYNSINKATKKYFWNTINAIKKMTYKHENVAKNDLLITYYNTFSKEIIHIIIQRKPK